MSARRKQINKNSQSNCSMRQSREQEMQNPDLRWPTARISVGLPLIAACIQRGADLNEQARTE